MPKRGDFDIEFDNDAELLLAEMEFNDDDKPYEIEMKLKVLDIYNIRLDERMKRKKFVIERDLLNLKK
jgi:transcriptional adapter 2-alpha